MATIHSDGLYEPVGLQYLIDEGHLSQDADPATYKCHRQLYSDKAGQVGSDEIICHGSTIVWSRDGLVKRVFDLDIEDEPLQHTFTTSFDHGSQIDKNQSTSIEPALVAVLKTQVHVYTLSGSIHVIPLAFDVARALPLTKGFILQAASITSRKTKVKGLNLIRATNNEEKEAVRVSLHPSQAQPTYCLTDLLSQIGTVAFSPSRKGQDIEACPLLPSSEEILLISRNGHLDSVDFPNVSLAVSLNRATQAITIWQVKFQDTGENLVDGAIGNRYRKRQSSNFHERSRGTNGRITTDDPRQSFGIIQSFVKDDPKPASSQLSNIENLAAELGRDFEPTGIQTRSARRISSMLARTDLAPANDRSTFAETVGTSRKSMSRNLRREGSVGSFTERNSIGLRKSLLATTSMYSGTGSLFETIGRASIGDHMPFEPDQNLDESDVRLEKKIVFLKLRSFNVSDAGDTIRVMLLPHPTTVNVEDNIQRQLSVCVHERNRKVMTVVTVTVKYANSTNLRKQQPELKAVQMQTGDEIADACVLADGKVHRLFVLTRTSTGEELLHLEAPWSPSYAIAMPHAYLVRGLMHVESSKEYSQAGSKNNRLFDGNQVKIMNFVESTNLSRFAIIDDRKFHHELRLSLLPSSELANKILDLCKYVLPSHLREGMLVAYWEISSWLSDQRQDTYNHELAALTISMFTLAVPFIGALQRQPTTPSRRKKDILGRKTGEVSTSVLGTGCTTLMSNWSQSSPWNWMSRHLSETTSQTIPVFYTSIGAATIDHLGLIDVTRDFLQSPAGESMTGPEGYLPTAMNQDRSIRRAALASIVVALYLLLEELKLSAAFDGSSDTDTKFLICLIRQLSHWLKWKNWTATMQEYIDTRHDRSTIREVDNSVIDGLDVPPEPFLPLSMYDYVDSWLRGQAYKFRTLHELISQSPLAHDHPLLQEERKLLPLSSMVIEAVSGGTKMPVNDVHLKLLPDVITHICLNLSPASSRGVVMSLSDKTRKAYPKTRLSQMQASNRDIKLMCNQATDAETISRWDATSGLDRQEITRLIFNHDRRFQEASRLVNQSRAPEVIYEYLPGWTEVDALEAQKLLAIYATRRTFAVVSGRGMMHFMSRTPLLTEQVPKASFSYKAELRPSAISEEAQARHVEADKSLFTEDKVGWAFFHNGVAAGLMISSDANFIDTSWILYNKPQDQLNNRHAGFLLALGLNGHLRTLAKWVAFKYLTPKHTMTSIGLLLGLAASYVGTSDTLTTRLLSVHVTCLLPPGAAELNLSPLTQTTGLIGIGLVYCNTQHRRMSEVMLSELECQDAEEGSNDEPVLRDEGYRLATGICLGLISLGQGPHLHSLHDMRVSERLLAIAVGTKNVNIVQILDRATAGAVIAIAFIYMKSNDRALAQKIDIPDTHHQYEYVRPDMFLLRTLARHLIMWDEIKASTEFIRYSLPKQYQHRGGLGSAKRLHTNDLPYYHVMAGLCFAIALKHAGCHDNQARDLLIDHLDQFMRLSRLPASNYDAKVTLNGIRNCLNLTALSCAVVMAGSGDLVVYRRLRSLHGRIEKDLPYGSHLAAHMAIGALFLSGGTATFGTSNLAVASLVIAFYPLFPTEILDNRSHLQALRHLWVLAAEHRCLTLRDNETGQILNNISATITNIDGTQMKLTTPALLPEFNSITRIHINADSYWPVDLCLDDKVKSSSSQVCTLRQEYQSSKNGIMVHLHQRTLYDRTNFDAYQTEFAALEASHNLPMPMSDGTSLPPNVVDWVLNLKPFAHLDHAERALLKHGPGSDTRESREGLLETTPVDTALELGLGTFGPEVLSGDMEMQLQANKLWQIRLLLAWADKMEAEAQDDGQKTVKESKAWLRDNVIEELRQRVWQMAGAEPDRDMTVQ